MFSIIIAILTQLVLVTSAETSAETSAINFEFRKSCYIDSLIVYDLATFRDRKFTIEEVQNIAIDDVKKHGDHQTVSLVYIFLMAEMVYDRQSSSPQFLKKEIYDNCLHRYNLTGDYDANRQ